MGRLSPDPRILALLVAWFFVLFVEGATVSLAGREGDVLRRTLGVALLYAFLGGLLALFVFA